MITTFQKQSTEHYFIALDWTGRLPSGKVLTSATASAIRNDTGADATATVLTGTSLAVVGNQAVVGVQNGMTGVDYLITLQSGFNDGSLLQDKWLMQVRDA